MFENKTVVIGIGGGIAAYKTAYLASGLAKTGADVHVIMTKNACNFINPITFETLTGNKCLVDTFDRNFEFNVEHVALAKRADVFIIAPATADVIAKTACGIADDMLTTTFLAAKCEKIVVPAMNTAMYENPVTQDNLDRLRSYGVRVLEPAEGYLACGDTGKGKMPEPEELFAAVEKAVARERDMKGLKVIVTAGATRESLDPVRFITNHSSGKMGAALAKECMLRGANVVLVKAFTTARMPDFVRTENVESAEDMFNAVRAGFDDADIVIMAAAVSDYTPDTFSDEKIKKSDDDMSISLKRTQDILKYMGEHKTHQFLCGFSMETQNMIENSVKKLKKKNADMIVANNLKDAGSGFGTDTNAVVIITKDNEEALSLMTKEDVAHEIVNRILALR